MLVLLVKLEIRALLDQMARGDHLDPEEWMSVKLPSSSGHIPPLDHTHREMKGLLDRLDLQEISELQDRLDQVGLRASLGSQEILERRERKGSRGILVHLENKSVSSSQTVILISRSILYRDQRESQECQVQWVLRDPP